MVIMMISGGIAALGGTVEIVGDFFCMERNVTGGYGFTAIIVIMLAKERVLGVPLATVFIAGMLVGATALPVVEIPSHFSEILIGVLLLFAVFSDYLATKFDRIIEARNER
jgi:simple sugar transport system permease protein